MAGHARSEPSPLGLALGRIPSGLFILTARRGEQATGMLASWVQQAGFDPPMLTVAVHPDRPLAGWIAAGGGFTLNQVAAGQKALLRHFARGFPPDAPAFEGLEVRSDLGARGGPVLADALTYLDCVAVGALDGADHRIVLARVEAGELLNADGEPMLHVRHNGFHY